MDINHIFDLFKNDSQNYDENSLLIDFSEHPMFWISGFNKLLDNHLFFKKYTIKTYKNINPNINIEELEKAGEALMFRKAWDYIKNINLEKPFHIDCLKSKADETFIEHLQLSIDFFENLEEYEKCALLKNIENKIREFLI